MIEEHALYRENPEFIEVIEGADTPGVRAVQQTLRFVPAGIVPPPPGRLARALGVGREGPEPDLPPMLSQQSFWDDRKKAVIISARNVEGLLAVRREVERAAPHGWRVTPSLLRQRRCQVAAQNAGVGVISLVEGELQCLTS